MKRRADDRRYEARIVAVGRDCDLALLAVDDPAFWENATFARFGELPAIRDRMTVVGFPIGGEQVGGWAEWDRDEMTPRLPRLAPGDPNEKSRTDTRVAAPLVFRIRSPRALCHEWKSPATAWRGGSCWRCKLMPVRAGWWAAVLPCVTVPCAVGPWPYPTP